MLLDTIGQKHQPEEVSELKYISISNIAALLTALTAFKVGRHDLTRAPGAFRRLKIRVSRGNFS